MSTEIAKERLAKDLKMVSRDAEDLLKATASDVGEKVREARSRLAGALESAKESLQEKVTIGARAVDHSIREHPYRSLGIASGIAFAAGLLLGVLVNRRNHN